MKLRSRPDRRVRILPLLLGASLLVGCDDVNEPRHEDVLAGLSPGIHPVVVLAGQNGQTANVELHLKRIEVTEAIASFQGEFRYDAAKLSLQTAEIPGGIVGAWNETAPGTIRFAGAALEGIPEGAVLRLRFTTKEKVTQSLFSIRLEEVVSAKDFSNLSARVVMADVPVFSATALD